jgi:hypothetical protein
MLSILIPSMDIGPQGRTNYGQNMRGRSALVMIDGVSLNSIRAISRQLDAIDPLILKELKCFRSKLNLWRKCYRGIINIITKTPSKKGISGETELGVRTGFMGKMTMISVLHNPLQEKERSSSEDWELPISRMAGLWSRSETAFYRYYPDRPSV